MECNKEFLLKNNLNFINLYDNIIFENSSYYKNNEFQQKYKYALIKILINEHQKLYNI
jgi:hypothetical protein